MSKILKRADKFKKELLNFDEAALKKLEKAYVNAYKRVGVDLKALNQKIAQARQQGETVSPAWLFRQERYNELQSQCVKELNKISKESAELIRSQQQGALDLATEHAYGLVAAGTGAKVAEMATSWNKLNTDALKSMVGFLADGSPLDYKFADMPTTISEGVKSVLTTGIGAGWNPRRMEREIRKHYEGALTNSLVTCRTETMRAYRASTLENYRANSDVVKGWIWLSAKSAETCAACWSMDGTKHSLDESFGDHPSGRCTSIPMIKGYMEGWDPTEHFDKLSEKDKQLVLGKAKYEAHKAGDIKLRDIAGVKKDSVWGDHVRVKNLNEIGVKSINQLKQEDKIKTITGNVRERKYNLDIKTQQQNKHTYGTKEFERGYNNSKQGDIKPSYFNDDINIQRLVDEHAGTGNVALKKNHEFPSEKITLKHNIGKYWSGKENAYMDTNRFKIQYSKKGIHIFPVYPEVEAK